MSTSPRASAALATLAVILAITASWWVLALWPVGPLAPEWLLRTREVCFGSSYDGLPNAGGWVLLVGQPLGMLAVLVAVWGDELRRGLARATGHVAGQVTMGVVMGAIVAGLAGVATRVRDAHAEPFSSGREGDMAARLTRVDDPAPALALTDQTGQEVALEALRGRPVLVTFAYAHCQTVCPLIVSDVMLAQSRLADRAPAVLIVTLDPWRDTPSRLAAIARQWGVGADAHVLSGPPEDVERTLNAWRVPRVRNEKTGDLSHPSMVYVVGSDGRIAYVVSGNAEAITAAVKAL